MTTRPAAAPKRRGASESAIASETSAVPRSESDEDALAAPEIGERAQHELADGVGAERDRHHGADLLVVVAVLDREQVQRGLDVRAAEVERRVADEQERKHAPRR